MNGKTKKTLATLVITMLFVFVFSGQVFAANKAACAKKAQETIDNLNKWIGEYSSQMEGAAPVDKGKYEEWIRELEKLKALVNSAKDKLSSGDGGCTSGDCVSDQCDMVDIAEQQVTQLIEETEEELGKDSVTASDTTGREVNKDTEQIGDDTILDQTDPNDATQRTYANDSSSSDSQSDGVIGDVFDNSGNPDQSGDTGDVSSSDPLEEISAQ